MTNADQRIDSYNCCSNLVSHTAGLYLKVGFSDSIVKLHCRFDQNLTILCNVLLQALRNL